VRADRGGAGLEVRAVVGVGVSGGAESLAHPLVGLVAALGGDQPVAEHPGHHPRLVGGVGRVPAAQVDADLGLPAGRAEELVEPLDVGGRHHVLQPVGLRAGQRLAVAQPDAVAVQRVAGDADVAAAEGLEQLDHVALAGVEVADAELAHLEGQSDEVAG
jgi:hypothetical protein